MKEYIIKSAEGYIRAYLNDQTAHAIFQTTVGRQISDDPFIYQADEEHDFSLTSGDFSMTLVIQLGDQIIQQPVEAEIVDHAADDAVWSHDGSY